MTHKLSDLREKSGAAIENFIEKRMRNVQIYVENTNTRDFELQLIIRI